MGEFDPSAFIGGGILAVIIFGLLCLALIAGVVWFGLWLTYTIIWRAVRRGLREYHGQGPVGSARGNHPTTPAPIGPPTASTSRSKPSRRSKRTVPLRPEAGPRDWSPSP